MPRPDVCTLPHSRHLSQPTQSMMRDTFRKWSLNSSFKTYIARSHSATLKYSCRLDIWTYVGIFAPEQDGLIELANIVRNFDDSI